MSKPTIAGPPVAQQQITPERLTELRKLSVPMNVELGGMITDLERNSVLVIGRHKTLVLPEVVIRVPISNLIQAAGLLAAHVVAPMLNTMEQGAPATGPRKVE